GSPRERVHAEHLFEAGRAARGSETGSRPTHDCTAGGSRGRPAAQDQGSERHMNLEDFRRLNFREVGNWPLLPRALMLAALFIVILGLGAWFDWKDQWEALDKAQLEEVRLKEQYATKKAKAINFDIYVQQLKEIEQSFGALLKQLPNKAEMDALLTDINQAGLGRGLQFELFKPAAQERLADFYAELPISVRVRGSYRGMGACADR